MRAGGGGRRRPRGAHADAAAQLHCRERAGRARRALREERPARQSKGAPRAHRPLPESSNEVRGVAARRVRSCCAANQRSESAADDSARRKAQRESRSEAAATGHQLVREHGSPKRRRRAGRGVRASGGGAAASGARRGEPPAWRPGPGAATARNRRQDFLARRPPLDPHVCYRAEEI